MPDAISDQLYELVRILFFTMVVGAAYEATKRAGDKNGRWVALRLGVGWAIGIAALATFTMGQPSCESSDDPIRGGCDEYADDAYNPTWDQRAGRFLFWALLIGVPVGFGVAEARKHDAHPWRRPEEAARTEA